MMSYKKLKETSRGKLTKEFLYKLCCREDGMYSVPHLNNVLYLHYQGITKIENLDDFTNVKCLYLQNNLIQKIENLECLKNLTMLYLNDNCITKIENLDCLEKLDTIDLSHNSIKMVENLSGALSLRSLDLSYNQLVSLGDVQHLTECRNLTSLRLSHNHLGDTGVIKVLSTLNLMRALFLDGNPFISQVVNYRKQVICQFPELTYLDNKPVKSTERNLAAAWQTGGTGAEELLKLEWKAKSDLEFKEQHLKMFERLRNKNPESYQENLVTKVDRREGTAIKSAPDDEIKLPWNQVQMLDCREQAQLVKELTEDDGWSHYFLKDQDDSVQKREVSIPSTLGHKLIIQDVDEECKNTDHCEINESTSVVSCITNESDQPKNSQHKYLESRRYEELRFSLEQRLGKDFEQPQDESTQSPEEWVNKCMNQDNNLLSTQSQKPLIEITTKIDELKIRENTSS